MGSEMQENNNVCNICPPGDGYFGPSSTEHTDGTFVCADNLSIIVLVSFQVMNEQTFHKCENSE